MSNLRILLIPLMLLALALPASGQGTNVAFGTLEQDTSLPVEVTAEQLAVDQKTGIATFTGNVVIGQGEMRLSAAKVQVVYRESDNGIARLEATGGVTLVSGKDAAESERADYDIDDGTIVMSGNVLLTQGRNAISAERMRVHLTDGTAEMSGGVKTILQPGGTSE